MSSEAIAVKVVIPGVPSPLFYLAQTNSTPPVEIGTQVTVEVSRRTTHGWVIAKQNLQEVLDSLEDQDRSRSSAKQTSQLSLLDAPVARTTTLKPILEAHAAFSEDQLSLFQLMADYYGCSLVDVIENAVPKLSQERPKFRAQLNQVNAPQIGSAEFAKLIKRAPAQGQLLEELAQASTSLLVDEWTGGNTAKQTALRSLLKKGLVELVPDHKPNLSESWKKSASDRKLSTHQLTAVNAIKAALTKREFAPILLFGVTGSGKTEVYLRAIEEVLQRGGSALVVVPEISLTPQLFDQFESRLRTPLALLHSQVGTTARWSSWQALIDGQSRVAIGARSAIFAPVQKLELIIVDEEHEHSYKQSDGLRYNARDVALMRGKLTGCPVILGSATPSYESLLNATRSKYQLLELPERVTTRPLPTIEVVDLNRVKRKEMPSPHISPRLHQAISDNLARGGQTIVLYNRRGFSSYLQCDSCQDVLQCTNCSVPLTYHRNRHVLLCHYCDLKLQPPDLCRICRDPRTTRIESAEAEDKGKLVQRGGGTEKVVDELAAFFPEAKIDRMDRDTVTRKESYREILGGVRSGETDILVGTQMIAKGHDLPGVTLVGIVDADVGLHLPDFRSAEKAYQLITQAAGRAGRGEQSGQVIVQTRQPTHPAIVAIISGRFKAFARYELERRKTLKYPPYGKLLRFIVSDPETREAERTAKQLKQLLTQRLLELNSGAEPAVVEILGPAPAPLERLRDRYRFHILIKASSRKLLSQLAKEVYLWRGSLTKEGEGRVAIDIDPMEML